MGMTSHTAGNVRCISLPSIFAAAGAGAAARIIDAVRPGALATARVALALGLWASPPVSDAIDRTADTVTSLVSADIGNLGFISRAAGQPAALTKSQSDALDAYNNAVRQFKSVLGQRRAQINSNQQLPNLPGQALYLARNSMISTYKDLTDALPSRIGRRNKFGIPPAYFDADNEPLIDEYTNLFSIMQAPPANAAGRISLGLFFAETNGNQNMGNARSNTYKGSLQTGVSEDQNGQRKWASIKSSIVALDPALSARDDKEEARIGSLDHRFNHWTAVRDALMNAHADLFPRIPAIVKALPNPIDQMKLFELIQIVPSPTRSALNSGNFANYRVSDPTIMGYLRNNSIFTFGQADRARTSATFREILDAMWLFNDKFERALSKFNEIKSRQKG
jgi:hypothetical protein